MSAYHLSILRCLIGAALLTTFGCRLVGERPSNARPWAADMAVLPEAELLGDRVQVRNVRNCTYLDEDSYVLNYYDKSFDLSRIRTVDFIVVPFKDLPAVAHTMLSFGFEDEEYLAVSVEIRREKDEQYEFFKGILDQYEIMYVVGDERDLVRLRTNYRGDDVYVYRTKATPEQARQLFVDVMQRVNKLRSEPEFYNTVVNNCTTNIMHHVNQLAPGKIHYGLPVLLPGLSDRLAYDLGLLEDAGTFAATREQSNVSPIARQVGDRPDFSTAIRR